jgi:hypothetical protein
VHGVEALAAFSEREVDRIPGGRAVILHSAIVKLILLPACIPIPGVGWVIGQQIGTGTGDVTLPYRVLPQQ